MYLSLELDLYADTEEFLITCWKDSSISSTISIFNDKYYNMDCSHARKWKFMSTVSTKFIYCDQEFLSSIEYWKISTRTYYLSFQVSSNSRGSNSFVSIDRNHLVENDLVRFFFQENVKRIQFGVLSHQNPID